MIILCSLCYSFLYTKNHHHYKYHYYYHKIINISVGAVAAVVGNGDIVVWKTYEDALIDGFDQSKIITMGLQSLNR